MKARYIRVSTANQNLERQLKTENPNEELFTDVCSGSIPFGDREEGKKLLTAIEGLKINHVSVHSIDRLGRNLLDILHTLELMENYGVTVKVDNLGIESRVKNKPNAAFKLIISVLANISEMERETMLERQREGIAIAKAKGKYKGRVRGTVQTKMEFLSKYPQVIKFLKQEHSIRNSAKLAGVSPSTVQKVKEALEKI